jgi:hypothetical protein
MFESPNGALAKDLLKRGFRVQARARRNLGGATGSGPRRVATGQLRASVSVQLRSFHGMPAVRIGSNLKHARWVHDGTGLYGPYKQMITPKVKKVLRWRGSNGYIFARKTRGMKANPFLENALPAANLNNGI